MASKIRVCKTRMSNDKTTEEMFRKLQQILLLSSYLNITKSLEISSRKIIIFLYEEDILYFNLEFFWYDLIRISNFYLPVNI